MADYGYTNGANGRRLQDVIRVLRAEGVPWRVLALKQDALTTSQLAAVNSGATASTVAQVAQNTANITTLMQTVTAGLRLSYVEELPAVGVSNVLYLVPQSDGTTVNLCNEYLYVNDAYELVGTTGAQANNGALNITVNGAIVGEFTANQATNTTAAITVPTDTGDLTNNAGYIDATALAGALASYATLSDIADKADDADVVHKAGAETITGSKTFSTSIVGDITGTANMATADASGNVITTTYATKTELSNTDATAVHKAGAETVTGAKTWTALQTFSGGASGNLTGNVTGDLTGTASKATADADGNTITSTYATKTELSTLSDTVGTKADDDSVVHLTGEETITGAKTFSDTVTSANVVPSATDTYSLGSASVQYNAIYGKSYFYNGTQWGLDQANTWTASNTFTSALSVQNNGATQGTAPTSNKTWTLNFTDVNGTAIGQIYNQLRTTGNNLLALRNNNGTYDYRLNFWLITDGTASFSPSVTDTIELGTSSNKWKTLNGINPGALSLPDTSSPDPIDTTGWDLTGATSNTYTATEDGWISIGVRYNHLTYVGVSVAIGGGDWYAEQSMVPNPQSTGVPKYHFLCVPVRAGGVAYVTAICSQITFANFYPCQGNV